ncbi:MAG: YCF48-related protein, partial [Calditrichaceae bacterium]
SYSNNLNRILFKDDLTGWAIGEKGMILHTVDGGEHWLLQTSNSMENLLGIDFIGTDSLCVVGENSTVLLADVTDNSWSAVELPTDLTVEDVYFADSTHGWVCGTGKGGIILVSSDGGHQWQELSPEGSEYHTWSGTGTGTAAGPGLLQQIYFDENLTTGFVLTAGDKYSANKLYKTTTSGSKWVGYVEGIGYFPGESRFCVLPGKRIVMTGVPGSFRYSDDYGKTIKLPNHDQRWWTGMIAGDNGKLLALQRSPKDDSYNFYRSVNYGNTFQAILPQFYDESGSEISMDNFESFSLSRFDQDTLRALFVDTDGILSIHYSSDCGVTFHKAGNIDPFLVRADVTKGDTIIDFSTRRVETEPGVYKTTLFCDYSFDGGVTIKHIENSEVWNDITPPDLWRFIHAKYFHDGRTGFVVGSEGNILKTTDSGQTWENIFSGVVEDLRDIEFLDRETGFAVGDFGRILKSEDGGETWRKTDSGTQEDIYCIIFVNDLKGWVGTESGMRYTTDRGETWQGVPLRYSHVTMTHLPLLPNKNYKFIIDHNYLYAINLPRAETDYYMNLLRTKIDPSDIYDYDISDLQPKEISLSQNFPNPFNSTTCIKYSLPKQGFVSLKIYNIQGQLVRTLLNRKKAAGNYSAIWDGRSDRGKVVSSGMYIYQIQCNGQTKTHKLLLLK